MNLTELLEHLSAKNVELWVDGDKLRYRSRRGSTDGNILMEKSPNATIIFLFSAVRLRSEK